MSTTSPDAMDSYTGEENRVVMGFRLPSVMNDEGLPPDSPLLRQCQMAAMILLARDSTWHLPAWVHYTGRDWNPLRERDRESYLDIWGEYTDPETLIAMWDRAHASGNRMGMSRVLHARLESEELRTTQEDLILWLEEGSFQTQARDRDGQEIEGVYSVYFWDRIDAAARAMGITFHAWFLPSIPPGHSPVCLLTLVSANTFSDNVIRRWLISLLHSLSKSVSLTLSVSCSETSKCLSTRTSSLQG